MMSCVEIRGDVRFVTERVFMEDGEIKEGRGGLMAKSYISLLPMDLPT